MSKSNGWLLPLTGVAFIVVLFISFVVTGDEPPSVDDNTTQDIVNHYVDNKDSIEVGVGIGAVAALLLVTFGAYLRTALRGPDGEADLFATLALVGTAIVAVGAGIDMTISFALAESAEDLDPTAVQALQGLWDNDFVPFAIGTLVFLTGSGIAVIKGGGLPKWMGWGALLFALVGIVGGISVQDFGFAMVPASALFILISSILLAVRARREAAPATG